MKHFLETEIDIEAPPEAVWAILMDFDSYAEWNPFIQSISGKRQPGEQLRVRIVPPGKGGMTFKPVITEFSENAAFEWLGKLVVGGLFDGRHRFELEATSTGTRFLHTESFSGLLVPLFRGMVDSSTSAGFQAMNIALKKRAESSL